MRTYTSCWVAAKNVQLEFRPSISQFVQVLTTQALDESPAPGPSNSSIELSSDEAEEDVQPRMPKRTKRIESSDSEGSDLNANSLDFNLNKEN